MWQIKAEIVAGDERESGRRALLNYGHTLAHALEIATDYSLAHGEAVAVGLIYAAHLARNLGRIDDRRVEQHYEVVGGELRARDLAAGWARSRAVDRADGPRQEGARSDGLTFVLDGRDGVEVVSRRTGRRGPRRARRHDAAVTTPRLSHRTVAAARWRDDDRGPYAALNADPEVMRHFPSTLDPAAEFDEMVDRMAAAWLRPRLRAVGRRAPRHLASSSGSSVCPYPGGRRPFTPCVEVGWRLGRTHWGNGFAPEAAISRTGMGFANVDPPGDEIVSFTTESNLNSQRVMEKIGMIRDLDGDFDHPMSPDWADRRHVLYRIDRRQFAERVAR